MDILLKIAEYGIVAAVVGLIAFLICGFAKLFFAQRINIKYGVADFKAKYDAVKDKESDEALIALDLYSKAKNQYTTAIKKRCNLISTITGVVLLVPFYVFVMGDKAFYTDIIFWTNLFAIPTIAALYYSLYQGLQDKNISVKVWLHKLVDLGIALVNYLKALKSNKKADPAELADKLTQAFEIVGKLSDEQKNQIKELLSKK
jgi:hypothetical protein